jgi:hypothetical protein
MPKQGNAHSAVAVTLILNTCYYRVSVEVCPVRRAFHFEGNLPNVVTLSLSKRDGSRKRTFLAQNRIRSAERSPELTPRTHDQACDGLYELPRSVSRAGMMLDLEANSMHVDFSKS